MTQSKGQKNRKTKIQTLLDVIHVGLNCPERNWKLEKVGL